MLVHYLLSSIDFLGVGDRVPIDVLVVTKIVVDCNLAFLSHLNWYYPSTF
jgi:hypothetical protein